jgi:hypothetical protein
MKKEFQTFQMSKMFEKPFCQVHFLLDVYFFAKQRPIELSRHIHLMLVASSSLIVV